MLCREIIAGCSEIHTKHINTLCGQNVELLIVILVMHALSTRLLFPNIICLYVLKMNSEICLMLRYFLCLLSRTIYHK